MPLGAGEHPLTEPRGLVPVQLRDQRQREGQGAVAALALGLLVDQPGAPEEVDASPQPQGVVEQVDVLPLQPEGLGLPQAQR
jgi:hypothetical protein